MVCLALATAVLCLLVEAWASSSEGVLVWLLVGLHKSVFARTVPQGCLGLEWTMSLGNLLVSRMEARDASERKSCSLVVWQVEVWMNEDHPCYDPYEHQGPVTGRRFLSKEDAVNWGIEKSPFGFDFSVTETFVY